MSSWWSNLLKPVLEWFWIIFHKKLYIYICVYYMYLSKQHQAKNNSSISMKDVSILESISQPKQEAASHHHLPKVPTKNQGRLVPFDILHGMFPGGYKVGPKTSCKWSNNPYNWPYKWVTWVISYNNSSFCLPTWFHGTSLPNPGRLTHGHNNLAMANVWR